MKAADVRCAIKRKKCEKSHAAHLNSGAVLASYWNPGERKRATSFWRLSRGGRCLSTWYNKVTTSHPLQPQSCLVTGLLYFDWEPFSCATCVEPSQVWLGWAEIHTGLICLPADSLGFRIPLPGIRSINKFPYILKVQIYKNKCLKWILFLSPNTPPPRSWNLIGSSHQKGVMICAGSSCQQPIKFILAQLLHNWSLLSGIKVSLQKTNELALTWTLMFCVYKWSQKIVENVVTLLFYLSSIFEGKSHNFWLQCDRSLIIYEMCLFSGGKKEHHYFFSFIIMSSFWLDILNQVVCISKKYLRAKRKSTQKYKIYCFKQLQSSLETRWIMTAQRSGADLCCFESDMWHDCILFPVCQQWRANFNLAALFHASIWKRPFENI